MFDVDINIGINNYVIYKIIEIYRVYLTYSFSYIYWNGWASQSVIS